MLIPLGFRSVLRTYCLRLPGDCSSAVCMFVDGCNIGKKKKVAVVNVNLYSC